MPNLSDTQKLHGKTYKCKNGQCFRFKTLGKGGLRVISIGRPGTPEEINEVNDFIRRELNVNIYGNKTYGRIDKEMIQEEQEDFQEFLKTERDKKSTQ